MDAIGFILEYKSLENGKITQNLLDALEKIGIHNFGEYHLGGTYLEVFDGYYFTSPDVSNTNEKVVKFSSAGEFLTNVINYYVCNKISLGTANKSGFNATLKSLLKSKVLISSDGKTAIAFKNCLNTISNDISVIVCNKYDISEISVENSKELIEPDLNDVVIVENSIIDYKPIIGESFMNIKRKGIYVVTDLAIDCDNHPGVRTGNQNVNPIDVIYTDNVNVYSRRLEEFLAKFSHLTEKKL